MAWPLASVTVAASVAVSPSAGKMSESGASATAAATCSTVTAASPDAGPAVAVILPRPFPTAVTTPSRPTAATVVSPLFHSTPAFSMAWPLASVTVAASVAVSPRADNVSESGASATAAATCSTVTAASRDAGPAVAVILPRPFPTAVTTPSRPTAATVVSPLCHSTPAFSMAWPLASVTVAASVAVSPRADNVSESGASATAAATCSTVTAASRDAGPAVAVILPRPFPTAVTTPSRPTAATAVSPLCHSTPAFSMAWPLASVTVAASVAVSPRADNVSESGARATAAGICSTVTAAVPDAGPAVALMVALPFPAAVTRPRASTVATPVAPDDHVTAASGIALPFWSLTVAASCTVAATAASSAEGGDKVTVVGTGSGTGSSQAAKAMASTTAAPGNRRGRNGAGHHRRVRFMSATFARGTRGVRGCTIILGSLVGGTAHSSRLVHQRRSLRHRTQ